MDQVRRLKKREENKVASQTKKKKTKKKKNKNFVKKIHKYVVSGHFGIKTQGDRRRD